MFGVPSSRPGMELNNYRLQNTLDNMSKVVCGDIPSVGHEEHR